MASSKIAIFFVALLVSSVTPHDDKYIRCTQDRFQCVTVHQCIPSDWRCEGEADCEDRSDERECGSPWWTEGAVVAGGAVVVAATQVAVAVLGFGVAGLGAGTWTAGSVSRPLTLGVGLGVVSTLPAIGATGTLNLTEISGVKLVGGEEGESAGTQKSVSDLVSKGDGKKKNKKKKKKNKKKNKDKAQDQDHGRDEDED